MAASGDLLAQLLAQPGPLLPSAAQAAALGPTADSAVGDTGAVSEPQLYPTDPGYVYGSLLPLRAKADAQGNAIRGTAQLAMPQAVHDLVNSAYQGITAPGAVASGERQPSLEDANALAGLLTGGAGAVPAEADAMRAGIGLTKRAQLADLLSRWQPPGKQATVSQAFEKNLPIGSAEQMAVAHPSAHGSYFEVAPTVPQSEFTATYKDFPGLQQPQSFDPEQLRGAHIVPFLGDRTGVNDITSVNGMPVDVSMYGGPGYGRANAAQGSGAVWASEPAAAGGIRNQIREGLDQGKRVLGIYGTMGPKSGDQSLMMSDLLAQSLAKADITKTTGKELDKVGRSIMPGFPGWGDPDLMPFLKGQVQGDRSDLVKALDSAVYRDKGVPDIGHLRLAVTDPALRDIPVGAFGHEVFELGPESLTPHPATLEHPTYSSQIAGTPVGRLDYHLPYDKVLNPDFWAQRRAFGARPAADFRSILRESGAAGPLPDKTHDEIMQYIEALRSRGP